MEMKKFSNFSFFSFILGDFYIQKLQWNFKKNYNKDREKISHFFTSKYALLSNETNLNDFKNIFRKLV